MHCTRRGNSKLPFPPGMHFPKYGNRKKASQQSMSKNQTEFVPFTQGQITWTLGAKGGVLLLRLWLWISKIKQQKRRKKKEKRKCNKTKTTLHKNSQYTQNTTTEICSLDERFKPAGLFLFHLSTN